MDDDNLLGFLLGILVLAWLVASVGGLIFCFANDLTPMVFIIMGQLLAVFGLYLVISGIVKENFQPGTLVLLMVGIISLAFGCIQQFGTEENIESMNKLMGWIVIALFFLLGIALIVIGVVKYVKYEKERPSPIDAVCVRMEEKMVDEKILVCPVYEFTFQGETIILTDEAPERIRGVNVGDSRKVYLNSYNSGTYGFEKDVSIEGAGCIAIGVVVSGCIGLTLLLMYWFGAFG